MYVLDRGILLWKGWGCLLGGPLSSPLNWSRLCESSSHVCGGAWYSYLGLYSLCLSRLCGWNSSSLGGLSSNLEGRESSCLGDLSSNLEGRASSYLSGLSSNLGGRASSNLEGLTFSYLGRSSLFRNLSSCAVFAQSHSRFFVSLLSSTSSGGAGLEGGEELRERLLRFRGLRSFESL